MYLHLEEEQRLKQLLLEVNICFVVYIEQKIAVEKEYTNCQLRNKICQYLIRWYTSNVPIGVFEMQRLFKILPYHTPKMKETY